jgi:FKBP-type peptidyl-prolyl cis-trans isomerase (trigger factor)
MTKPIITKAPDGTVAFELTLPAKEIATEYQKVLLEVAKTTEIKGFRKGKAPIAMVESISDKTKLYSHVLDHLLSPAYSQVITTNQLTPLIEPRVTPKNMKAGEDWVMAIELAIAPEISLGDYANSLKKIKEADKDKKLQLIFDTLLSKIKFDITPLLIEAEANSALSRLVNQLSQLKLSVANYAKSIKKTPDELVTEYKKSAQTNLKIHFILQAIQTDHKLKDRQAVLDFLSTL